MRFLYESRFAEKSIPHPFVDEECPSCQKVFLTRWWTGEYLPRHYHPLQFLLAPLRDTSKNCKETIFALGNGISRRKNRPAPGVHAAGYD